MLSQARNRTALYYKKRMISIKNLVNWQSKKSSKIVKLSHLSQNIRFSHILLI